ncbi:MAG: ATP-binding protein [Tropicimonas sp.]|uniref:ATP-binding protein n=1 Tax=Tropicimonas sp. TaxID=2067044 RepID=UPI003A85D2A8
MHPLGQLFSENEDWLVDRVVNYAVSEGLAEHTAPSRGAWRVSIRGLSAPLVDAMRTTLAGGGSPAALANARDRIVAFGTQQALRHRARGLGLAEFLGLLKCCRRAYLDLIDEKEPDRRNRQVLRGHVLGFFDHVEIGLCTEWKASSNEEYFRDLQAQNRHLSDEKNKYLTIFESIREPVIWLDAGGVPVHLNDASQRLFCDGGAATGASYYSALRCPLLTAQIGVMLNVGGGEGDGEEEGEQADMVIETLAGPRDFNVRVQKMLDVSRRFTGTVIILNDVSNYKRALRQAQAADRAKSAFLATLSHEIRTPVAGALGLARLLRDTPLSARQGRLVSGVISSAELLSGVLGDILDFSRAEVGAHPPAPRDFALDELIRQVLIVVEPMAREKGLALSTGIAPSLPARLHGDAAMIRQVLLNLTHNAIKFTRAGSVEVRVGTCGEGGRIRFELRDTGPGLPPGPAGRLFEPFIQGDPPEEGMTGGLGLGLATAARLVHQMDGEIGCHPREGGGSVFHVDLPLEAAHRAPPARMETGRARILLVEDDPVNRMVAEGYAGRLGHDTRLAASAAEALRWLERERFDLVISDNRMPGMPGLELVRRIKSRSFGPNCAIPVILSSASEDDMRLAGEQALPPDGFLPKPFDMDDLAAALARHLPASLSGLDTGPREAGQDAFRIARQHVETLGPEKGARVIAAFAETAPELVTAIEAGRDAGDGEVVRAAAHRLAGSSGLLGLGAIEALARDIEARAGAITAEDLAYLRAQIGEACDTLRALCGTACDSPSA